MKLLSYLHTQRRRLTFFSLVERSLIALFVFALAYQFFHWALYLAEVFVQPKSLEYFSPWVLSGVVAGLLWVAQVIQLYQRAYSLRDAAEKIEEQSDFFAKNSFHRSELQSAAEFAGHATPTEFEKAHLEYWNRRLENFRVELRPSAFSIGLLFGSTIALLVSLVGIGHPTHQLPERVKAWNLSSYEELLSYPGAIWQQKAGAVSSIMGAKVRFEAPSFAPFQTYIFLRYEEGPWTIQACESHCEFQVKSRGRYAVGTLLYRSAQFPLLASEDQAPRAVIFLKEAGDLVPSPTISALNEDSLPLQLMATDDLSLQSLRLIHRFESSEEVLLEKEVKDIRFKEDYTLDVSEWKGGRHEIVLEAKDFIQSQESAPLVVMYADEEFLREQRILSIRSLLDQWLHVLADLLESEENRQFHSMLFKRIEQIEYPAIEAEGNLQVFVEELRRLGNRIIDELPIVGTGHLPEMIRLTEKQILYGLSLILQERAGDLQASTDGLQNSQRDLQSLIDQIRNGEKELTPEAIQEAFEKLARQLEELQEKIRNLPQGPNDDLINREALQEQMNESEELQERIAQIQEQIANGNDAQALKELESLMNQLSILSKEIGRSFDQWQENLAQGAMQASEGFEKKLKEIRERQEQLAEKTEVLEKKNAEAKKEERNDEKLKELKEEFESLQQEQQNIQTDFEEAQAELEEKLTGSEWEQVFRSGEMKELESEIQSRMQSAQDALQIKEAPEALVQENEAVEYLKKAEDAQRKMRQQVQQMSQPQEMQGRQNNQKIEIIESEGRGEKERRQKIMNSLRQKVDDTYQKSHERYFEELLQR